MVILFYFGRQHMEEQTFVDHNDETPGNCFSSCYCRHTHSSRSSISEDPALPQDQLLLKLFRWIVRELLHEEFSRKMARLHRGFPRVGRRDPQLANAVPGSRRTRGKIRYVHPIWSVIGVFSKESANL